MQTIINYLWSQSWQIAFLALVIAVVSYMLKNKSAHIRYLLWLLLVAKCVSPAILNVPLPLLPEKEKTDTVIYQPIQNSEILTASEFQPPLQNLQPIAAQQTKSLYDKLKQLSLTTWLTIIWVAGISLFLTFTLIRAVKTQRWLIKNRKPLPADFKKYIDAFFERISIKKRPNIWLVDAVGQPFVWGLFRGGIYLPNSFIQINETSQQNAVLAHELCHITRFDALINLLQIIAQSLFWFHPFVWWANKKVRAEREKCCDETAIAQTAAEPSVFSSAILNTLITEHTAAMKIPSLAVAGPVKNIEERIKTIMKPNKKFCMKPSPLSLLIIAVLFVVIIPTSFALTTSPASLSEINDGSVDENVQFLTDIRIFKIGPESTGIKYFLMSLDDNVTVLDETQQNNFESLLKQEDPERISRPRILQNNGEIDDVQISDDSEILIDFEILPIWLEETRQIQLSVDSLINDGQDIWQENENFIINSGRLILLSQQTAGDDDRLLCLLKCTNVESIDRIKELGNTILIYANDNEGRLPENLSELIDYGLESQWFVKNIEYIGSGKTINDDPFSAIAYDKSLFVSGRSTNVLYLDGHVKFENADRLRELGILNDVVQISARLLELPAEQTSEFSSFLAEIQPDDNAAMLNDEQVHKLIEFSEAEAGAKLLAAPRIRTYDNEPAAISVGREIPYVVDVNEEILDANGNPQPILNYIHTGIMLDVKTHITPDNNIYLEFNLTKTEVTGYSDVTFEEKYTYKNPMLKSTEMASKVTFPLGQTILNKIKLSEDKLLLMLINAENRGPAPVHSYSPSNPGYYMYGRTSRGSTKLSGGLSEEKPSDESISEEPAETVTY